MPEREEGPQRVCLCGSTEFRDEFMAANLRETVAGKIVLTVGYFGRESSGFYKAKKKMLDELHKRKIDLADEILVLNVGGYIGTSTGSEIAYAKSKGKLVRYLVTPDDDGEGSSVLKAP